MWRLLCAKLARIFLRRTARQLFEYWDGAKKRHADPMRVFRAIKDDPEYREDVHPQGVDDGDPEAIDVTLRCVRRVLGVGEWSEGKPGLTELETLQLFVQFHEYLDHLKKNISPSQTPPRPTEWTSQDSSEKTTSNTSGSGSTESDPTCEPPTSPGSE